MIRKAVTVDIPAVVAIYNQAIAARFQTAFMEQFSDEAGHAFFVGHLTNEYPLFVYEKAGTVAGWASISPYRQGRSAFRYTVEVSYFVHSDYFGQGVGSALLQHVLNACKGLGYKTAIAIILSRNAPSISIVEKFGFEKWAYLPDVADFDGEECSHLYYGKKL